jgi:chemotaxis protein CheX
MNAIMINAFVDSTVNVIKTMAFIDSTAGRAYLKAGAAACGDVSGIIGFTGSVTGSLAVSFSEKCILKIVSNMLGEEFPMITRDIEDAVGELTNMISGDARKRLQSEQMTISASIPSVVSGKNHTIKHILGTSSIVIPFVTVDGSFVVDVCIKENVGNGLGK